MRLKDIDESAWSALYAEWKASKITQKDFCKIKGFDLRDFIYRREKSSIIRKKYEHQKSLPVAGFIKLERGPELQIQKQESKFIELQLPHGIILRIPA